MFSHPHHTNEKNSFGHSSKSFCPFHTASRPNCILFTCLWTKPSLSWLGLVSTQIFPTLAFKFLFLSNSLLHRWVYADKKKQHFVSLWYVNYSVCYLKNTFSSLHFCWRQSKDDSQFQHHTQYSLGSYVQSDGAFLKI